MKRNFKNMLKPLIHFKCVLALQKLFIFQRNTLFMALCRSAARLIPMLANHACQYNDKGVFHVCVGKFNYKGWNRFNAKTI